MAKRTQKLPLPILLFLILCALIGESIILFGRLLVRIGMTLIRLRTRGTRQSFGLRTRLKSAIEWGFPLLILIISIARQSRRLLPNQLIARIIILSILLLFLGNLIADGIAWIVDLGRDLPHPTRLTTQDRDMTTLILDRNGTVLYRLYEQKNRTLIALNDLPEHVIHATVAIEDRHFYRHFGVDPLGILRAAIYNVRTGQLTGGSTITQQLVKNTLLTPEKTWRRKLREIILAFWTERIYTKDQILQMYLNEVAYGGPAWGIETASLTYFGKHAASLTLGEAALIAGLPAAPTSYSPFGPTQERTEERQRAVLRRMVEDGYITNDQAETTAKEILTFAPQVTEIKAPHFVMFVRDQLSKTFGNQLYHPGGMRVSTTLDFPLQEKVEGIVREELAKLTDLSVTNAAVMITDARTGEILVMVGSRDYFNGETGNFNVTTALRQPGSAIKPVTYALALQEGFTPKTVILDTPVSFPIPGQPLYRPVNYDSRFHGPVTLREALGNSFNIPAVKLLATLGVEPMIQLAGRMGIDTFSDRSRYGLSLTLGGGDVTMLDMMEMYGTLASGGDRLTVRSIQHIDDARGSRIETVSPERIPAIPPQIAYILTDILKDNHARILAFGPNSPLSIEGHSVAVKTGTSDNKRDNWTFGYTPDYVVGVWVGNNDNRPMHPRLTSGITGAAPIWRRIMLVLLEASPARSFEKPPGVEMIDYTHGNPCPENSCQGGRDLYITGTRVRAMVKSTKVQRADGTEEYIYLDRFSGEFSSQHDKK